MMERMRTLIWYAMLVVILLVLHHLAVTYRIAVVDTEFTQMEPTVKAGSMCAYKCGRSVPNSLKLNDIIAFEIDGDKKFERYFARVLAVPGSEVVVSNGRLLVDGNDIAVAPRDANLLKTGMIIPKETVLIGFEKEDGFPLSRRLVSFRNIVGRVLNK